MKKDNLAIAVISRSRPMGETFQWIRQAKIPVFAYIHEPEKTLYKEQLPENFNIVTHNFNTVGEIRNYVHRHQAKQKNKVLILDDDITGIWNHDKSFMASINEIIEIINATEADLILFQWQLDVEAETIPLCGAYVAMPNMAHIKMNEGIYENEDFDGYLQYFLHGAKIHTLPFIFTHEIRSSDSHFNDIWKCLSMANMYKKYGDIVTLKFDMSGLYLTSEISLDTAEKRKNGKIQYKNETNAVIEDCIQKIKLFFTSEGDKHKTVLLPELQKILNGIRGVKTNEQNI